MEGGASSDSPSKADGARVTRPQRRSNCNVSECIQPATMMPVPSRALDALQEATDFPEPQNPQQASKVSRPQPGRKKNEREAPEPVDDFELSKWLIDPRESSWVFGWDMCVALALVFTALVTPYEVAFLGAPKGIDVLFILNRCLDAIFLGDVVVNFFLIQSVSDSHGDRWITDHRLIVLNYLKGWFTLDIFSITISLLDFVAVSSENSGTVSQFKVLRVVRVLRLIKLLRLLRTSRLIKRWETRIRINYAALGIVRILVSLLLCTHWQACTWTLGASFTQPTPLHTWLHASGYCINGSNPEEYTYEASLYDTEAPQGPGTDYICMSPSSVYAAATYWSAMTITSIGYGDIAATPGNAAEQALATFLMLSGAMLWGQVVATFCSVVSSLQATDMRFRETLDHLNDFMASEALPLPLQWRLREFFFRTKHLRIATENTRLIQIMSPGLQAETLALTSKRWLRNVRFLHGCDPEFIASLVLSLRPTVFTPDDVIMPGYRELFVIHRGVALYGGKLLQAGSVWGEDVLLECEALRSRSCAKALTYLETNSISREMIFQIASRFPLSLQKLRRFVGFLALHRQVVVLAKIERAMREQNGDPAQRSSALERFFRNAQDDEDMHERIRWLGNNRVDHSQVVKPPNVHGAAEGAARAVKGPSDPRASTATMIRSQAVSLTVLKQVGRTECLSGFYAEASGAPAAVIGLKGSLRGKGGAATAGRGAGAISPPPDHLAIGAPDRTRPFAPRPVREAGDTNDARGYKDAKKQQWHADGDDEVPRAVATTSSFSVRPGSYAAEFNRPVASAGGEAAAELTRSLVAANGNTNGNGNGAAPSAPLQRRRPNKLQQAARGASVEELRGELHAALAEQQRAFEGLFAQLRSDLQRAGSLPPAEAPGTAAKYEA